jgi:AcrR family transcriptional regulator
MSAADHTNPSSALDVPAPAAPEAVRAPERQQAHDAMLDAAEAVVLRDGIGCLTLDAVAREARLSKGGLLHHFHSKDALIDALVKRIVDAWRDEFTAAIDSQPDAPGRVPGAFLSVCLSESGKWTESLRRRGLVLVAALVHDAKHVEPVRAVHRLLADRIAADGLPPGVGEAVMLAADGLWFNWIFGLREPLQEERAAIRAALTRLVGAACCPAWASAVATPPGVRGEQGGGVKSEKGRGAGRAATPARKGGVGAKGRKKSGGSR